MTHYSRFKEVKGKEMETRTTDAGGDHDAGGVHDEQPFDNKVNHVKYMCHHASSSTSTVFSIRTHFVGDCC
jgi:hypothetical protein